MSQEFIAVSTGVVAVINGINIVYSIQSGNHLNLGVTIVGIIILILLMFLTYYRWKIKQDIELIKEYKTLMKPLGELSLKNSNSSLRILQVEIRNENLLRCWRDYYHQKSKDINTKFYDLNDELDKVISNPYRLLYKNKSSLITKNFGYISKETETLYDKFNKMVRDEKIPLDNNTMKQTFENFIQALNKSRNAFPEIENEFLNGYSNPFN